MGEINEINEIPRETWGKIDEYIERYTAGIYDGKRFRAFDPDKAGDLVDLNYSFCDMAPPAILVAANPLEAQMMFHAFENDPEAMELARRIHGLKAEGKDASRSSKALRDRVASLEWTLPDEKYNDYLFTMNVYSNIYFAWHKFIQDEIVHDEYVRDDLNAFDAAATDGRVYSAICSETCCVVSKYPKRVFVDDNHELHNTAGPAVEWDRARPESEFECYFVHGREVPAALFKKVSSGGLTKKEFLEESNEENRAFMYSILGDEGVAEMLDTVEVSRKTIEHRNGEAETLVLVKTRDAYPEIGDRPFAWVKYICPSTEQVFLIPCEPHFEDALEAAASQSPLFDASEYSFDVRA